MQVNRISFGQVIKLNNRNELQNASKYLAGTIAPEEQKENRWLGIVEPKEVRDEHKGIQEQLKSVFYDTDKAPVRFFSFENPNYVKGLGREMFNHYIVTGNDSANIGEILKPMEERYSELREKYNGKHSKAEDYELCAMQSTFLPKVKEYIDENKATTEISFESSLTPSGYQINNFEIIG